MRSECVRRARHRARVCAHPPAAASAARAHPFPSRARPEARLSLGWVAWAGLWPALGAMHAKHFALSRRARVCWHSSAAASAARAYPVPFAHARRGAFVHRLSGQGETLAGPGQAPRGYSGKRARAHVVLPAFAGWPLRRPDHSHSPTTPFPWGFGWPGLALGLPWIGSSRKSAPPKAHPRARDPRAHWHIKARLLRAALWGGGEGEEEVAAAPAAHLLPVWQHSTAQRVSWHSGARASGCGGVPSLSALSLRSWRIGVIENLCETTSHQEPD